MINIYLATAKELTKLKQEIARITDLTGIYVNVFGRKTRIIDSNQLQAFYDNGVELDQFFASEDYDCKPIAWSVK